VAADGPVPGPDEARRLAEEILSRPEYQPPTETWWQTALDWVQERFSRLLGTLVGGGTGQVVGWVIVAVVLAAVVFLVVRLVRSGRLPARGDEPAAPPVDREPVVDWDAEAARLEAAGRWREGLRARYRALVVRLGRRGAIDPAAARTTGDHRAEVGGRAPGAAREFDAAAELFDRAWYGGRPTGAEESRRFAELADAVERDV
jgi:hypothetical protein